MTRTRTRNQTRRRHPQRASRAVCVLVRIAPNPPIRRHQRVPSTVGRGPDQTVRNASVNDRSYADCTPGHADLMPRKPVGSNRKVEFLPRRSGSRPARGPRAPPASRSLASTSARRRTRSPSTWRSTTPRATATAASWRSGCRPRPPMRSVSAGGPACGSAGRVSLVENLRFLHEGCGAV